MGKTAIGGYVKLNAQRSLHQGKTLIVLLCMTVFFIEYFKGIRGPMAESGLNLGVHEFFPVMMNTSYIAFTVWIGYILLVCDLPYDEGGFELYLTRAGKRSWMFGQFVYMLLLTVIYFVYLQIVLLAIIVPQISFADTWSNGFVMLVSKPTAYGIFNHLAYSISVMREQTPYLVYIKQMILCILAGSAVSSIILLFNMFWKNGLGIGIGGVFIALDYLVTAVILGRFGLFFLSPLTMTRLGCVSNSSLNTTMPSFGYACCVLGGIVILAAAVIAVGAKRYEFKGAVSNE